MNKSIISTIAILSTLTLMFSCGRVDPNINKTGEDELKALEIHRTINEDEQNFQDIIYVPIYSDIYVDQLNQNSLLAATLSIRNTSYKDSLFITKIDYFNTAGTLVRNYIENPINIPPMGTVNYVVEKDDKTGGAGANFIVNMTAKNKNIRPLVQAIMIGHVNKKGFAFSTDGYSIKAKNTPEKK